MSVTRTASRFVLLWFAFSSGTVMADVRVTQLTQDNYVKYANGTQDPLSLAVDAMAVYTVNDDIDPTIIIAGTFAAFEGGMMIRSWSVFGPGQYSASAEFDAAYQSCYGSTHAVTAEGVLSNFQQTRSPICTPRPPSNDPPPILTVCDPGHDCVEGELEPLILDLDGDGIATTSLDSSPVRFDLNGDGVPDVTAWTAPFSADAFLYYDRNHNGIIDGGTELFGDATVLASGSRASSGVEALASHDANQDGVISPADAVWGILRLWIDRNHDGVMTASENYSMGQANVLELSLEFADVPRNASSVDGAGNWHRFQGSFAQAITGGGPRRVITRALHDVYFRVYLQARR